MDARRPTASLSLDLDNCWTYQRTRGLPGWESFPSFLSVVVPRVLEILRRYDLRITFFIVGQDAAITENRALLRRISEAGHEIGNHSFSHEPWLHLYDDSRIEREIVRAEDAIADATGRRTKGFRGPGHSLPPAALRVLVERGYEYDASQFSTFVMPFARLYYFRKASLSSAQRQERRTLGGRFREGFGPNRIYQRTVGDRRIWEVPVTTVPIFRLPFHLSYLQILNARSPRLALGYFRAALRLCAMRKTAPSLLVHPTDFLGAEDDVSLDYFPTMNVSTKKKLALVDKVIEHLISRHEVLTIGDVVAREQGFKPTV